MTPHMEVIAAVIFWGAVAVYQSWHVIGALALIAVIIWACKETARL